MNDNWIADLNIQDSSALSTSVCDISNNPLLGNPRIGFSCVKNNLYSSNSLPNTISRTSKVSSSSVIKSTRTTLISSKLVFSSLVNSTSSIPAYSYRTFRDSTKALGTVSTDFQSFYVPSVTFTFEEIPKLSVRVTNQKVLNSEASRIISSDNEITSKTQITQSVKFVPLLHTSNKNTGMIFRIVVSTFLLGIMMSKTPFKREFNKFIKKDYQNTSATML